MPIQSVQCVRLPFLGSFTILPEIINVESDFVDVVFGGDCFDTRFFPKLVLLEVKVMNKK